MREYLTSSDVANSVSMMHTVFPGTVLVVEGVTDSRLYGKFTDRRDVRIVIAHSKDNVREVIKTLSKRGMKEAVGIVDADLDRLTDRKCQPPLFRTDTRDSESMVVMSDSFREVLWEYADPEKLEAFEARYGDIRQKVEDSVYPLGLLMYVSYIENLNLRFKDLDFERFIDGRTLSCDRLAMCREVVRNTSGCEHDPRYVRSVLREYEENGGRAEHIVRGHDLVAALALVLRDAVGGTNAVRIGSGPLGSALRLSYDMTEFSQTALYRSSSGWAEANDLALWIQPSHR